MLDADDDRNQTDDIVLVGIEDARMWAKANRGNWRGEKWSNVVKRAARFEARGIDYEIRYYSARVRRSEHGDGIVDVVATHKAA